MTSSIQTHSYVIQHKDSLFKKQTHKYQSPSFLSLKETFNADKLNYIIEHFAEFKDQIMASSSSSLSSSSSFNLNLLSRDCDSKYNHDPLKLAQKYLQKSRNGRIDVIYTQSQNNQGGRHFAIGSLSLQSLKKSIRHTIANDHYLDIDIKNCHPVILQHLCHLENLNCPFLDEYVSSRDALLQETNIELNLAKDLYLALTNGGNKDYNDLELLPNRHLQGYKLEMIGIHKLFSQEHPDLLEKVKEKRRSNNKDYNHEAALTNVLLCNFENRILMTMYEFFGKPENAVLCFDGIMLPKKSDDYDIDGCVEHVAHTLGIHIQLCTKPMDKGLPIPNEIPSFRSPSLDYYSDFKTLVHAESVHLEWVKEWSRNTIKLIENGGRQFFLTKNKQIETFGTDFASTKTIDEWLPIQSNDIEKSLKVQCFVWNPYYNSAIAKKVKEMDKKALKSALTPYEEKRVKRTQFETLGLTSPKLGNGYLSFLMENRAIDSFDRVVFYPFLAQKGMPMMHNCFNVFTGFPPETLKLDPVLLPKFEDSKFYKHLKTELFNDNIDEFNHFLDHIADIIQDPARIKGTSHLFYSRQGTGKGLLSLFMAKMIGSSNIATIINTDTYFDKNFNSDRVNKLLKVFEEVSEKGSAFKNHNRLKGEQTSVQERIENKGIDPYHTLHCARFWYFTNNENSLHIEADDRRHTLHKINNRMANNFEYFKPMWEEMDDPLFVKSAFLFLANRVYTSQSVLNSFDTKFKNEQKVANIPNGIRFLIDYIQTKFSKVEDKDILIESAGLRDEWRIWCQNYGCQYHLGTLQTQIKLIGIQPPTRFRTNGSTQKTCYKINTLLLQQTMHSHFKNNDWSFDFGQAVDQKDIDSGHIIERIL